MTVNRQDARSELDMANIRPLEERDRDAVWGIMEPVFRAGETYPFATDIGKEEALRVWVSAPATAFVFDDGGGGVLGTYYIKPNQATLGAHVCNCGYIVAQRARGRGIATEMCRHSQLEAKARGYRAMQYNLVVSTNEGAVRLWKSLGFAVIGTLPGAFRHSKLGFVDAHVMYKNL